MITENKAKRKRTRKGVNLNKLFSVISFVLNIILIGSLILVVGFNMHKGSDGATTDGLALSENGDSSGGNETCWSPGEGEISLPDPMNNVSDDGIISVKQKKYVYKGLDVMILDVTNNTSKHYTLTIKGEYKNKSGQVFKTETRVFEGFPAGYSTYFVFREGYRFSDFSYQIAFEEYTERPYAAYFDPGTNVHCRTFWGHVDERGEFIIPIGAEQVAYFPREIMVDAQITDNVLHPCEKPLTVTADFVLFNDMGELVYIGDTRFSVQRADNDEQRLDAYVAEAFPPITTGIPAGDVQPGAGMLLNYPLPDEYKGLTGFLAVKEVYPTYEGETAFPRTYFYYRNP